MALIEGCKHSLSLEIPADAVAAATEIAAAGIQAKVRLPGFRPGKAPLNIVKSRFAAEIRQEALDSLLPKFFTEAVKKEHLEVVSQPTVKDLHFHAGEPVKFVAEFEVAPTFDLGEYRGLVCTYSEPEVTEEDLTKRIDQLRDSKAEFVNEEPRALVDGDHASISLESLSGVDEKVSQDELTLKLGDEHTLKEFTEALRGAAPGDVRELEVTYPEDYERKTLAGRTVKFVPEAVCYPIEPHNFHFMSKQLKRWSHGFMQNVQLHWKGLLPIPFLRSVIGVALWESTIASVIYLGIVPLTALMTRNPLVLIVYILDAPALMVPVLMQASRRNEFWKAVVSIPSFFVLRIVNCLFVLEAIWSEFITGQRLAVYEKGH